MWVLKIVGLAIVQGLAELLPVSSSAHVLVAEKLMGLDPSTPAMTFVLVMLHTGTMAAVIVYFWRQWQQHYFQSAAQFKSILGRAVVATLFTGIVGATAIKVIEKTLLADTPHAEIEQMFSHLEFIAPALAAAGLLILIAGFNDRRRARDGASGQANQLGKPLGFAAAAVIGVVQGLCLPFRGFSRSGATISTGMLLGVQKAPVEAFSFALAVVITPPVIAREAWRLHTSGAFPSDQPLSSVLLVSVLGALVAFAVGVGALKWLSRWLEGGRWYLFGLYCLLAAAATFGLHASGF